LGTTLLAESRLQIEQGHTQSGQIFEGVRGAFTITPKDLLQYAGVYWSEELETQYTFSIRNGKLLGIHAHHGEFELKPFMKDRFTTEFTTDLDFMAEVKFVRNNAGRLTGAAFGGDRVRQVDFVRK